MLGVFLPIQSCWRFLSSEFLHFGFEAWRSEWVHACWTDDLCVAVCTEQSASVCHCGRRGNCFPILLQRGHQPWLLRSDQPRRVGNRVGRSTILADLVRTETQVG